jgi:hypothetical protein
VAGGFSSKGFLALTPMSEKFMLFDSTAREKCGDQAASKKKVKAAMNCHADPSVIVT